MSDVKWIKISTDVFNNSKIKIIEAMPEGDALIVIWFKILMLAGDTNDNGMVYFAKNLPFNEITLSTVLNKPISTIKLALSTFEQFGMIEIVDDFIHISNWEKYQNVNGLEKIREQTRLRVAKHREIKKLECNVTSNVTETECNETEEDIEIEKDKEIDKEIETDKIYRIDYDGILNMFHNTCKSLSKVSKLTDSRKKKIKTRLVNYDINDLQNAFIKIEKSDFLSGRSGTWKASFDWIFKNDENIAKVLEGNYDNNKGKTQTKNRFDKLDEID